MLPTKTFAAVSLMALSLAAPAYAGSVTTFAVTTDVQSNDITWTENANGIGGTLNTAAGGNSVQFQYEHIAGLQSYLQGTLNAVEYINGGAGVSTSAVATQDANYNDSISINSAFTISYLLATPVNVGGQMLSNLLTATITPVTSGATLAGTDGGTSATYSASTNIHNLYTVSFSSSFLNFGSGVGNSYSVSLAFNSVTPGFNLSGSDIASFVADLVGTFAANPVPTSIPEVPSAALLIIGMAAVGVASRRRAAASV
jgi:hypothetical protein